MKYSDSDSIQIHKTLTRMVKNNIFYILKITLYHSSSYCFCSTFPGQRKICIFIYLSSQSKNVCISAETPNKILNKILLHQPAASSHSGCYTIIVIMRRLREITLKMWRHYVYNRERKWNLLACAYGGR